jgi:RHS repeat-associated protein
VQRIGLLAVDRLANHMGTMMQAKETTMTNQVEGRSIKSLKSFALWAIWTLLLASAQAWAQTGDTVTYVYTDPQGTPLAEADASGNITATFEYTPYGAYAPQGTSTPGPAPKGPGYTGHVNDSETNLVYMQARYYDPVTGRFLTIDPVDPNSGNTFSFNRYAYVYNNPIMHTDPNGKQCAQCLYYPESGLDHQAGMQQAASGIALSQSKTLIPGVGNALAIRDAYNNPTAFNVAVAAIGFLPEVGGAIGTFAKEAKALSQVAKVSAAERATTIAGGMSARTQRSVTIAVTETQEGTRLVSSSEGALRSASKATLQEGEVAVRGVNGVHAEVNGINAAREMGLTPTGVAASRPICSSCAAQLEQQGVAPLSPLKQPQ